MSEATSSMARKEAGAPGWDEIRAYLMANPGLVREDAELLSELGLKINAANVIEFGPAALARHVAARVRETNARLQLEQTARANFAAQAQTHAAVIELLEARNNADLARRIDEVARLRFGLVAGVIALEGPEPAPAGWRLIPEGLTDGMFGVEGLNWMGQTPYAPDVFGGRAGEVMSCAMVRLAIWSPARQGVLAFGAGDAEAFTPEMGAELVTFLARVVERTAERWPVL